MTALLSVKNLKTYFFTKDGVVKAVDDVSFEVEEGETFGLIGESGCGKSTLGLSILRLVPSPGRIVGGKIMYKGEDLIQKNEEEIRRIRGKEIAMIFQDPTSSLNPVLTIGDQIAESIKFHEHISGSEASEKTAELLEMVGIPNARERMNNYPHQFSGGMRQRAMIAMAISCNPALLIADEPTTNLDVTIQAQILDLLNDLKRKLGMSMIYITHNICVIAHIADRVGVMYAGKIVEIADVKILFKECKHPYTEGLLGAIPGRRGKERRRLSQIPGVVPSLINPPSGCIFHPRCKKAMEVCRLKRPSLYQIEPRHFVSCFLYQ